MKKIIGKCLRKILPWYLYKLIANGFIIVPKYYKGIIKDAEHYRDYSLQECDEKTMLLLRKHAHILDKGLHRQDASNGHSVGCYQELSKEIARLQNTHLAKDPTYIWGQNKKNAYEELQRHPKTFEPLHGEKPKLRIKFEDFYELIKQRRTIRYFLERTIQDAIIHQLKETANWASNSCNKQPISLFVTNNPIVAAECLTLCAGGTGFGNFIPSFWAFTADTRGYVWPLELYLPAIDVSLGAQNVFLAAHTLGISGTILSWALKTEEEEDKLRNFLKIPKEYTIVFCAVMGYAAHWSQTPVRKTVSQ